MDSNVPELVRLYHQGKASKEDVIKTLNDEISKSKTGETLDFILENGNRIKVDRGAIDYFKQTRNWTFPYKDDLSGRGNRSFDTLTGILLDGGIEIIGLYNRYGGHYVDRSFKEAIAKYIELKKQGRNVFPFLWGIKIIKEGLPPNIIGFIYNSLKQLGKLPEAIVIMYPLEERIVIVYNMKLAEEKRDVYIKKGVVKEGRIFKRKREYYNIEIYKYNLIRGNIAVYDFSGKLIDKKENTLVKDIGGLIKINKNLEKIEKEISYERMLQIIKEIYNIKEVKLSSEYWNRDEINKIEEIVHRKGGYIRKPFSNY